MTTTTTDIDLVRDLAAPLERVYAAWTEPGLLAQWYCPNPDLTVTIDGDVAVGAPYRVHMGPHVVEGEYTALEPPHTVAFTWQWAGSDDPPTHVRVELSANGTGTRLRLRHTDLNDQVDSDNHREGWEGCLARLPVVLG